MNPKTVLIPKRAPGGDTRTLAEAIALVRRKFNPNTIKYDGEQGGNYVFVIRTTN